MQGTDLQEMLTQGAAAARQGMENTRSMQARKGRASYLGERSIGHHDPAPHPLIFCWRVWLACQDIRLYRRCRRFDHYPDLYDRFKRVARQLSPSPFPGLFQRPLN